MNTEPYEPIKTAVVLAGGKGTRLRPFTVTFPKPLVPLGDRPILDLLLHQLADQGIERVVISLGHLSSLIRAYLSEHEELQGRLDISYVEESSPLGTAGALGLLDPPADAFFVMNGDLVTDLDFAAFARKHRTSSAALTIGRSDRRVRSDFGLLQLDAEGRLTDYVEKPVTVTPVSMGVYIYEPRVLSYIPTGQRLDLPELAVTLVRAGEEVLTYLHDGLWLDIGRPEDYAEAQDLVHNGTFS